MPYWLRRRPRQAYQYGSVRRGRWPFQPGNSVYSARWLASSVPRAARYQRGIHVLSALNRDIQRRRREHWLRHYHHSKAGIRAWFGGQIDERSLCRIAAFQADNFTAINPWRA